MTSAKHREGHAVAAAPTGPELTGRGPGGMWLVAWRLHRIQVAVLLAVMVAAAAAMVVFRVRLLALYERFDCARFGPGGQGYVSCSDDRGLDIWWSHGFANWSQLAHNGMLVGPVILGAFAAAPLFTREFSRGTQVLALTQSVRLRSWFVAKTVVMVVPLIGGLLTLGYLMEWMDGAVGQTAFGTLSRSNFFIHGPIPAATGLMAFGLALAVGMMARVMMAALTTGIIAGGVLLAGVAMAQPHLLPADRTATPVSETFAPVTQAEYDAMNQPPEDETGAPVMGWGGDDPNQVYIGSGFLDLSGKPVDRDAINDLFDCYQDAWRELAEAAGVPVAKDGSVAVRADQDDPTGTLEFLNADNAANLECARAHGVSADYQDMLPGSKLTPLRWAVGGILVGLWLLLTAVAVWHLRWAVAKR